MKTIGKFNMYYFPGLFLFWVCLVAYNFHVMTKADGYRDQAGERYDQAKEIYRQADSLFHATDSVKHLIDSLIDKYKK